MKPSTGPTILQLVLVNETGDSYYRMRWPAEELCARNPGWRVLNLDARGIERLSWAVEADLLVLYQSMDYELLPLIERRRKAGKRTIAEYNDNFYHPPTASPLLKEWSSPFLWQAYEAFMKAADAVMVTGPGLQELFQAKTDREVVIVRNYLPPGFRVAKRNGAEVRSIGWAGSQGHAADLLSILPIVRELAEQHPSLVFHLMGNEAFKDLVGLPPERVKFRSWGTMNEYFDFWREVDVGIIATLDTPYNRCRSDIKALEIAGSGALPVIPNILPYEDFCRVTGAPSYGSLRGLKEELSLSSDHPS